MKKNYYVILLIFMLILLACFQYYLSKQETKEIINVEEVIINPDPEGQILSSDISVENYMRALEFYEVKFKKEVLAQAILETGYFKSYNCRVRNNTLGLFNSRKMQYFEFDHWSESIKGYKNMIEYRLKDDEDYYNFLKRIGYAEDPNYIAKVKRIVSSLEEDENGVITYNV